jgi:hypothetical protein
MLLQVVYMKVADVVKNSMTNYVPLTTRISIQSASNELNKLLCMMASAQAGYHIEEFMQVNLVCGGIIGLMQTVANVQ